MLVIGIVGGIASGKSRVAELFGRLGAAIIDADQLGHAALRLDTVKRALRERWGEGVFGPDGQIDRSAVARIVFAPGPQGEEELEFLESVTHPLIGAMIRSRLAELAERADVQVAVLDAAVLVEAGWTSVCDRIVFVDVNRAERMKRAYCRGWSEADFASREARQVSLEEKRKLADGVIDNSGPIDHTFAQVQQFWQSLDLSPPEQPFP